jgi:hypothetical protein
VRVLKDACQRCVCVTVSQRMNSDRSSSPRKHKMPVIGQDIPGQNAHGHPLLGLPDHLLEGLEVALLAENPRPSHRSIEHMVRISPAGYSDSSWHARRSSSPARTVNERDSRPNYSSWLTVLRWHTTARLATVSEHPSSPILTPFNAANTLWHNDLRPFCLVSLMTRQGMAILGSASWGSGSCPRSWSGVRSPSPSLGVARQLGGDFAAGIWAGELQSPSGTSGPQAMGVKRRTPASDTRALITTERDGYYS